MNARTLLLLATLTPLSSGRPTTGPVVPFLEDDYPRALAQARARKVPLFIEA